MRLIAVRRNTRTFAQGPGDSVPLDAWRIITEFLCQYRGRVRATVLAEQDRGHAYAGEQVPVGVRQRDPEQVRVRDERRIAGAQLEIVVLDKLRELLYRGALQLLAQFLVVGVGTVPQAEAVNDGQGKLLPVLLVKQPNHVPAGSLPGIQRRVVPVPDAVGTRKLFYKVLEHGGDRFFQGGPSCNGSISASGLGRFVTERTAGSPGVGQKHARQVLFPGSLVHTAWCSFTVQGSSFNGADGVDIEPGLFLYRSGNGTVDLTGEQP